MRIRFGVFCSCLVILSTLTVFGANIAPVFAKSRTSLNVARQENVSSSSSAATSGTLRWAAPALSNPEVINVSANPSNNVIRLDPGRDYIIRMPDTPVRRGLVLVGGHNIHLIGGEIFIPWQGNQPTIPDRTALKIKDATGIVHIEGLLLRGDDLSEGIQIDAPAAIVQLQNMAVVDVHARDQVNFSDNHPDIVQTYGNVAELRIDRLTGSTDYQGLFLSADFDGPHGPVYLSRVNIVGMPTARQLVWFGVEANAGSVHIEDVWLNTAGDKRLGHVVWPEMSGSYPAQAQVGQTADKLEFVSWPAEMSPRIDGRIYKGLPPGGNFVNPEDVGIGYVTPGEQQLAPENPTATQTPAPPPAATQTAVPTKTPAPPPASTPTPSAPSTPEAFKREAEAGEIAPPFVRQDRAIVQLQQTVDPAQGGRARYNFKVTTPGNYAVRAVVLAPSDAANSLFVNIDGEPNATMIWHIKPTNGYQHRFVTLSEAVSYDAPPMVFALGAGNHQLIIRGREANVKIDRIVIENIAVQGQTDLDLDAEVDMLYLPQLNNHE